ncbi:antibiotic biosynthesis monooxygenase family protein [Paenibacillus oceani]|uniref:Antibiotic biosynthesis monooxygenase n=1 Tax=Paenibacillus oceani TaxID=2772510 RepID=A0A927C881_9BACL|nr:antibiotic biosynthesis monooxygenase [Paenibacillus oceani]MBD2862980.1 antibiotic biosynthesis monooxygenase [Paenibacillus oceani]
MFFETITITVKEGTSGLVVDRFSGPGHIEKSEGFIDMSITVKKTRRGDEEVMILIRWESEAAWKGWETSDVHIEGHRQSRSQPKPDHIIDRTHSLYEVKAVKGYAGGQ